MNQLRQLYPSHSAGIWRSYPEYIASLVPCILRCIIHASLISIGLIVTWKWDMPMKNLTCSNNFNVKHINEGQRISFKENCSKNFNLGHRCWCQHRHRGYQIRSPQLRWDELKINAINKQNIRKTFTKYILSMYLILHKGLIYNQIYRYTYLYLTANLLAARVQQLWKHLLLLDFRKIPPCVLELKNSRKSLKNCICKYYTSI